MRRKGSLNLQPKYHVKYLDVSCSPPIWNEFDVCRYKEAVDKLNTQYHYSTTVSILQNLVLNRNNKLKNHQLINIQRIAQ
jgi:hypothetical protein